MLPTQSTAVISTIRHLRRVEFSGNQYFGADLLPAAAAKNSGFRVRRSGTVFEHDAGR